MVHDFESDPTRTSAQLRGTRLSWQSSGYTVAETRLRFGLGVQLQHDNGVSVGLAWDAERNDDYEFDAAILSVHASF